MLELHLYLRYNSIYEIMDTKVEFAIKNMIYMCVYIYVCMVFCLFICLFLPFRATLLAYGSYQARGLNQSYSCWPAPQPH